VINHTVRDEVSKARGPRKVLVALPENIEAANVGHPPSLQLIAAWHLHAIDEAYELAISRLRQQHPRTRVVGVSYPLADARDMAAWLGAPAHHTYSFSPSANAEPVELAFHPFPIPHSTALLHAMIAPTYEALMSAEASVLCVVPTRAQCRTTARDLVTLIGAELESDGFLGGAGQAELENYAVQLSDRSLSEALIHGVGLWHDGLSPSDQRLILHLFAIRTIRALILPRESAIGLPPAVSAVASLAIVMGAQTVVAAPPDGDARLRKVRDYTLAELVQLMQLARAPVSSRRCLVMCQPELAELYARHLEAGLPIESRLADTDEGAAMLRRTIVGEVVAGQLKTRQDAVDLLSWTYLAHRLRSNPDYYDHARRDLSSFVDSLCSGLRARGLVFLPAGETHAIQATELARRIVPMRGGGLRPLDRLLELGFEQARELVGDIDVKIEVTALRAWQSRLSKTTRTALDDETPMTVVLLAGWFAGRTPVEAEMEAAQADVVLAAVKKLPKEGRVQRGGTG
jgi:hypothetical protein